MVQFCFLGVCLACCPDVSWPEQERTVLEIIVDWEDTTLDSQQDEHHRCAGTGKYEALKLERMKHL